MLFCFYFFRNDYLELDFAIRVRRNTKKHARYETYTLVVPTCIFFDIPIHRSFDIPIYVLKFRYSRMSNFRHDISTLDYLITWYVLFIRSIHVRFIGCFFFVAEREVRGRKDEDGENRDGVPTAVDTAVGYSRRCSRIQQ